VKLGDKIICVAFAALVIFSVTVAACKVDPVETGRNLAVEAKRGLAETVSPYKREDDVN